MEQAEPVRRVQPGPQRRPAQAAPRRRVEAERQAEQVEPQAEQAEPREARRVVAVKAAAPECLPQREPIPDASRCTA